MNLEKNNYDEMLILNALYFAEDGDTIVIHNKNNLSIDKLIEFRDLMVELFEEMGKEVDVLLKE